jgi:hypothetical protein
MDNYKLAEEKYFDEVTFKETMKIIESYYKLDPKL